jgi:hypothetical protein
MPENSYQGKMVGVFFMGFITQYLLPSYREEISNISGRGNRKITENPPGEVAKFQLSEGEIHYLYWFIQGSIMAPDLRHRLRRAWGFCERHAWGAILVEAAFRQGFMHGPALLYDDLLEPALPAFHLQGPLKTWRLARNLSNKGPCPMCEMGFGPDSIGKARPDVIERGRDVTELLTLARKTERYWEKAICGRCAKNGSIQRCRRHLIEDASIGLINGFSTHLSLVEYICHHISRYYRSFRLEFQGTETEENMAALISAVGWCSGWGIFLRIYARGNL